jgi:GTP cyclohydrolase I
LKEKGKEEGRKREENGVRKKKKKERKKKKKGVEVLKINMVQFLCLCHFHVLVLYDKHHTQYINENKKSRSEFIWYEANI